jgi:hypothetical protein
MAGRRRQPPAPRTVRIPTQDLEIDDPQVDRILTSHAQAVVELQNLPGVGLRVVQDVELVDTKNTYVAHPLGRAPMFVGISAVRGALGTGIVRDLTDGKLTGLFTSPVDRKRYVVLRADGFGATVHVDILVI